MFSLVLLILAFHPARAMGIESRRRSLKSVVHSTTTIRNPSWTYFHLTLVTSSSIGTKDAQPALDDITVRLHLTSALNQFLGVTGTAIPVDILKVEGSDAWIRVPTPDGSAVNEALSGWVGNDVAWRIRGRGCWLGGLTAGDEQDIFDE